MYFARHCPTPHQTASARVVCLLVAALMMDGCRRARPPTPPPTVELAGRVTGSSGVPIAGASVALTGDPDDGRVPVATAKTTAAGTFRIERVPVRSYLIRARAPGYVDGMTSLDAAGPAGVRPVELSLTPTVMLAGRIQDGRGSPVPLARVLGFAVADATSSQIHETRADERGAFKLMGLAPGAHRLLIEAPGLGTASAGPVQAPDASVVVVLPGEIRAILGRVLRGHQPAGGARVQLGGEGVPELRTVDSDAAGRFAFAGLGPGTYALRAEAGGLVSPIAKEVVPEQSRSRPRQVDLALMPGGYARGRVIAQDGAAVPGAAVHVDLVPATGLWSPVITDEDGSWTSPPLAPGSYRIQARKPGFMATQATTVTVGTPATDAAAGPPVPPATLKLMRTGQIHGLVVDDRGAPLPGATVHDRLAETEELGVIWARLPLAAEAAAFPRGAILPSSSSQTTSRRATTDGAGAFALLDVPPGRVQVEVLNSSSVPLRTPAVNLTPGGRLDLGILRVQRAVYATGKVVDSDDQPVKGARVIVAGVGAVAGGGLYALTGADGAFSLPLSAGEHRLTASAPGQGEATIEVRLGGPGTPSPPVILRLQARRVGELSIDGTVHDADRRPLSRARVTVRAPDDAPGEASGGDAPLAVALTNAGGAFRATGLSAGMAVLEVQHEGYALHRQTVDVGGPGGGGAAARTINIVVPIPGRIDGEVHERITGAPVPRFQIDAQGPEGSRSQFPGSSGGNREREAMGPVRFRLKRLTPGRWTLRAHAPGYRPLERTIDVASAGSPGEPSVRDLRLDLDRS